MERQSRSILISFSICFSLFYLLSEIKTVDCHPPHKGLYGYRPTKLFVFGDSYADTGNNRKSLASSWKVPYGVTFPGKPSGRFSDGRVLTDYLAKYLGLKSPVPYRWMKYAVNRLRYGINFAYGGTGVFDTLFLDPNMTTQIGFLQHLVKNDKPLYTTCDLNSSLALVTLSGNDYSAYLARGGSAAGLQSFITKVVTQLAVNIKLIHEIGVKKVVVASLQPLGCLPRSTAPSSYKQCNSTDNIGVNFHNLLLQQAVATLNNQTKDTPFVILDLYNSFLSVLNRKGYHTGSLKFESPFKPCCMGECGKLDEKGGEKYTVCDNPEGAFFWDQVHPTQAGWRAVYYALKSTLEQITRLN